MQTCNVTIRVYVLRPLCLFDYLFERSEFRIDTPPKKKCVCVRLILVLVGKTLILVLVWGKENTCISRYYTCAMACRTAWICFPFLDNVHSRYYAPCDALWLVLRLIQLSVV